MRRIRKKMPSTTRISAVVFASLVGVLVACGGSPASATYDTVPSVSESSTVVASSESGSNSQSDTDIASVSDVVAAGNVIIVNSDETIRAALAKAEPGDTVHVVDGEYTFRPRVVASASGTASLPITLEGSKKAIFRTKDVTGDYGLHITGDYWHVTGITIAHGTKGIVLDGSVGTIIDNVDIYDIGGEAVHFRACSSDSVLRNSYIHQTGMKKPQYGEGVYVGTANAAWSKYRCTDAIEGLSMGDNTERVVIEDNMFEDVPAEGVDIKEGTDAGVVRRNSFRRVGTSGMNSADSAIDVKGNNWVIEDNSVYETDVPWTRNGRTRPSRFADGFQSHAVYPGYGTMNNFRRNVVNGDFLGFGVGLYPALGNEVACDNAANEAGKGLVGDASNASVCK